MSPWFFNVFMVAVIKEVKMRIGKRGVRFLKGRERVEIAWPLLCRLRGFMLRIGGRPKGNGGTYC